MLKLYHAPRTRSVRVRWLLEEMGLAHELVRVDFRPQPSMFAQSTPLGKFPVLDDDGILVGESGAIVEYILERHGDGRFAPPVGSPLRGPFLQWVHFAEGTAFPPLGVLVWHLLYRGDAGQIPLAIESARERALAALDVVERHLATRDYLLGEDFSAADIMLGFTAMAAQVLGVLGDRHPALSAWLVRVTSRPAFLRATAD